MASSPRRQASIFVNGNQVEATAKNITAAFRQASNELGNMVVGGDKYLEKLEEVRRLDGILKQHRDAVRGVEQGWNLAKGGLGSFIGVAAGAFTVDALIGYGKELFGVASQMELMEKKARTVFGDTLPKVTAEAENNARAMGLTNAEYVTAAANIQDLLVPMGFQRKEAADISVQLTNLSGALSEWSGGQRSAKEVSEILSKSLLGERDALNSLGIDIKQAEIDAELFARGLDKLTGESQKQAEAMVTLDLILRKSTDAQQGYADGADSIARRSAELTARISENREKLATLLIPIFERLVAIASPVIDAFGDIIEGIDGLVNPAKAASRSFDEQAQKVAELETTLVPLLDRYDDLKGKSNLSKKEQDELKTVIQKIGEITPGAITAIDQYGNALSINATKSREFLEAERARLKFINQDAIRETQKAASEAEKRITEIQRQIESGTKVITEGTTFNQQLKRVSLTQQDIKSLTEEVNKLSETAAGANAELKRLKGENLEITKPPSPPPPSGDGGRTKEGEAAAEKEKKKQEKLEEDLKNHLARIQEIVKQNEDEARLASLSKDEADLERIRLKYQKEIDLVQSKFENEQSVKDAVAELEAQREAELEKARAEQREAAVDAEIEAYLEDQEKIDEAKALYQEEKAKAEAEIKEFEQEALFTERELELQVLQDHYTNLLKIAEQYGINTTSLKEAYAKKQADIEKKFADKSAKEQAESLKVRLAAMQSAFSAFGDFTTALFDLIGTESEDAAALQKIATLAKIAFDTASAISSLIAASEANPTNAVTFGAAGAAQFIAGIARILANVAQAKKILSGAPQVKQKYEGSYLVTGESDGRQYYAQSITAPSTGLLPGRPVLFTSTATGAPVLASERGAEYFVAAKDLSNPYVANLVRMIDNITNTGSVPQFQEGGANPPGGLSSAAPVPALGIDPAIIIQLTQVIGTLNSLMANGIVAVIPDRTITDMNKRYKIINEASGGFFS